ncbi:Crp/Fnr family transcriptional regulator [Plasticicumulans acidivorans]|uniref:CRP-like cAMP-binding protein n=1 Tax=Plasticicumulans acidivorans TaxID=886464 RepID=A0A317MUM5_9GAMM|nr:Crp/Fnr family transcriptional regulator [Plasticicumulans acidivorans]PWV61077.1 CRP-like cAMP-binding protein [Plasticicumulans acidivorans]
MSFNADPVELLGSSPLFADLAGAELVQLAALAHRRSVKPRETICRKGAPGGQMFAVLRGRLKVTTVSSEGREAILALLSTGDLFGEVSLLDGAPRSANVIAVTSGELLVLERADMLAFLEGQPPVSQKLMLALCRRLRSTDALIEDLLFRPLTSRLARRLLELGREHGQAHPRGVRITLRLSQEELGQLSGSSRESVNRQLAQWDNAGVVTNEGGHLLLLDLNTLQELANKS